MQTVYIIASKDRKGQFTPREVVEDLDEYLANLEYRDVVEGDVQVWEYPTGNMSSVGVDRKLSESDYYATPYNKKGTLWLPVLESVGIDTEKVKQALKALEP